MTDREIQKHLHDQHSDQLRELGVIVIPPGSKAAKALIDRLHCGDPQAIFDIRAMVKRIAPEAVLGTTEPAKTPAPDGASRVSDITQESAQAIMDKLCSEHGQPQSTVTMRDPEAETPYGFAEYLEAIYVGSGATLLDRYINGVGSALRQNKDAVGDTNFECSRKYINEDALRYSTLLAKFQAVTLGDLPDDVGVIEYHAVHRILVPWMSSKIETRNIQIDVDLEEIFLDARPLQDESWKVPLCEAPFYIDIKCKTHGERSLSGIFCIPTADKSHFEWMAVFEWIGLGYESFVLSRDGADKLDILMSNEVIESELLERLHKETPHKVEKIISMAMMHFKTVSKAPTPMEFVDKHGDEPKRKMVFSKKDLKRSRLKERTHSYFKVARIHTPDDRFGQAKTARNRWSLDHLLTVSGHFRWQPHGQGRTLYKLIWIDSYDKGEGSRTRPETNPTILDLRNIVNTINKEFCN